MPGHIIHKQIFNIGVATEERAHKTGETIKDAYVRKVLPDLDQVFSALSPENQIYRFDRIEIDLGIMPVENLDSELPDRIIHLIKEAITERIEHTSFHPPESRNVQVIPVSTSLFDAFIYYLEHGLLPWWFTERDATPTRIFGDIPDSLQEDQINKLKRVLKQEKTSKRLARQFSDDFVAGISGKITRPETKLRGEERDEAPTLFSVLLNAMLQILDKFTVDAETRNSFRLEMMKELMGSKMAYARSPQELDAKHKGKPIHRFIESSVHILIVTLAGHGIMAAEIRKIPEHIRDICTAQPVIEKWFREASFSEKQIEKIIQSTYTKSEKESAINPEEEIDKTEKSHIDDAGIYIKNAGAVLLSPFIKKYFDKLGLLAGNKFKSSEDQNRAALLLQHAITGDIEFAEYLLPLNKIMCGIPVDEPVRTNQKISAIEKKEAEAMIQSAIQTWKAIGKVSVIGFRESFLNREGRLKLTSGGWSLKVERKTIDILLDKLPWMISMVKLKWMKQLIYVDW